MTIVANMKRKRQKIVLKKQSVAIKLISFIAILTSNFVIFEQILRRVFIDHEDHREFNDPIKFGNINASTTANSSSVY